MSGVWVFKNGVVRLVENPAGSKHSPAARRKALVHSSSGQVVSSYANLEAKLTALGWERYYDDPDLFQFQRRSSIDLISLPKDFNRLSAVHMYDIVIKNRDSFRVADA